MAVKKFQNFENRMKKMEETFNIFNRNLEEMKNKQTAMNDTITQTKNALEGINHR